MGEALQRATKKLSVKYHKVTELSDYEKNSRTHSEKQLQQIASSIEEFGFTNPLLIDEEKTLIAGHGRLSAAKQLGLEKVPTITLTGLSDTQKRAYVIADNKLALNARWDDDLLALEIEALQLDDFDLDIIGFDEIPEFADTPDYSILDEEELEAELNSLQSGVRKAIQIEFEPKHYGEAQQIITWWRQRNAYIGKMLLEFLKQEKAKIEA